MNYIFIERSNWTNCYVFTDEKTERIIGVGSIGAYWGSETESSLFTIFVSPDYQGKGIGKRIMKRLENDEYFLRAKGLKYRPPSLLYLSIKNWVMILKMVWIRWMKKVCIGLRNSGNILY